MLKNDFDERIFDMSKTITRILSVIFTFCLVIKVCENISLSSIDIIETNDTIISDELVSIPNVNDAHYIDDEVIIMLADNEQTETMEFYSIYSDDYASINEDAYEMQRTTKLSNIQVAGSTSYINSQLDLGVDFTEMKLLNPSSKTTNGLYTIGDTNNNIFSLKLDGTSVEDALEILNSNPAIEIAEPNYLYELCETPNDALYNSQYALQSINAEEAWDITTGSSNVVVGIIDTGIDGTHPDLIDNLWNNPFFIEGEGCSVCSCIDDYHGYNFTGAGNDGEIPCGGTPTDIGGHGTLVAGIVGAKGNNSIGISGVNWNVDLAWLGCSVDGGITNIAVIEALNYANNHSIGIVNMSYGGYGYSSIVEYAINNYDGLCIIAAGNNTVNNDKSPFYPSSYDCSNILSVAATDVNDNLASYSNYGTNTVDVAAPGTDLCCTYSGGLYDYNSGTSLSAPMVTGIAALIKANNPSFTPLQIKAAICGTVQQMGKTYNVMYDGGIVDAAAAVAVTADCIKEITFNHNNYSVLYDTHIDCIMVGQKVREPVLYPQKTNHIFDGWYTSKTGGTLFDFDTEIYSDMTIYAHWVEAPAGSYGDLFPDYKFRNEVLNIINATDGGVRTADTIVDSDDLSVLASITSLDVSLKKIRDLTGIEYFTGLITLNCSGNRIEALDVSMLTQLQSLDCSNNLLIWLRVGKINSLLYLYCSNNLLPSLSLRKVTSLKILNCSYNELTTLDTSTLTNLTSLYCSHNQLTSINLSNTINYLYANNNKLEMINVNGATNIIIINVSNNEMNDRTDVVGFEQWDYSNAYSTVFDSQNPWANNPFTDISSTDYYYKSVQYVHDNNILTGESSSLFVPTKAVTRGELVNVLYTMAGRPSVTDLTNPFSDVSDSADYLDAVKWAYNNGEQSIMVGTSSTIFNPNGIVSREMVAVVLERYANRQGVSLTKLRDYETFADESDISSWALDSVSNLYEACVINGTYSGFNPAGSIIKGDLAVLIRKFEVIRQYA